MQNLSLAQIVGDENEIFLQRLDLFSSQLWVCSPAIVNSFDKDKQTITAQLVTQESYRKNGIRENIKMQILADIPVVFTSGGGWTVTFPVKADDECLLIFADNCIEAWQQNGGEENVQREIRRHSLSDCFALVGVRNQKRVLSDFSEDSMQIRNDDATTFIDIKDGEVTVKADKVNLADSAGVRALIDERFKTLYDAHTHTIPTGSTGAPNNPIVLANHATSKTKAL